MDYGRDWGILNIMAEELNPPPATISQELGMPAVIIPKPFVLAEQDKTELSKLKEEVMSRVETCENKMSTFYSEWDDLADNWRMIARKISKKPKGLFNSKSGETHRGTEALCTLFARMLTASDPFYEAVAEGFDDFGNEITEEQLYAVESLTRKQLNKIHFKEKLLRSLRSLSLFGTMVVENPFISFPYGNGQKSFQATDLVHRSLLRILFDPFVYDLDLSDFIATVDFPTIWRLRNIASSDPEIWDQQELEKVYKDFKDSSGGGKVTGNSNAYSRLVQRKSRAGYNMGDDRILELINYHGRIDTENSVVQAMWESRGRQDDPNLCDFSLGILNGESVIKLHPTPYRSWHHLFKAAHYKLFEEEPIGYGVGRIGKKHQREIDVSQSRASDLVYMAVLSMWKLSRFAGLKANQLNIKPLNVIELDDINGLEPLRPPIEAVAAALQMQGMLKEDFRTTTGATSTLQAQITKATATEASLTQNEAMRAVSIHAECIAETFLREFLETNHINNLDLLDEEIWVRVTGTSKPRALKGDMLPRHVGFEIRTTTDKDFRPERNSSILQAMQAFTSMRNFLDPNLNAIRPLLEEYFRGLGINPALLNRPVPISEQLANTLKMTKGSGGAGNLGNEVAGEAAGVQSGGVSIENTPVGAVPSSPNAPLLEAI